MNRVRKQTHWIALIALVLVFAACKGESPTAPPVGGGIPGGGVIPPTGATITVTASPTDLEVDQTTVLTATVTVNNQPALNGTAVEFVTTRGTFADTGTNTTIRTTTNGVATASLSSATAGTAVVTVTVNNVSRIAPTINFRARPVTQPRPSTDPTITSVTPTFGLPSGGETIRIAGTNFRGRVRVFFDIPGEPLPRELFVTGQTETEITAITPNVQLAPGQELTVPIRVVVDADTANQKTVSAPTPFVFRTVVLTPEIVTASPNSGPITGGTRVTVFGNNFQAPVQVLFGAAEARVIGDIRFDSIIVETPPAHEALGSIGSVGTADLTVVNINSNKRATLSAAFRYTPSMAITGITPLSAAATATTDITVSGLGLDGRLQATVGGREVQIIRTSGTSIVLRLGPSPNPCAGTGGGPVVITNLDTGQTATSAQSFSYIPVPARIVAVAPIPAGQTRAVAQPGGTLTITVRDPGVGIFGTADIRFVIGGVTAIANPSSITNGTGEQQFTVTLPLTGFTFPVINCNTAGGAQGRQFGSLIVPVVFNNLSNSCTDTLPDAVQINPPSPNNCVVPTVTPTPAPNCAAPANLGNQPIGGGPSPTTFTVQLRNSAPAPAENLTITAANSNTADFTVAPASASLAPGAAQTFTITFDPASLGAKNATITFTTNDPANPQLQYCVIGTGAP